LPPVTEGLFYCNPTAPTVEGPNAYCCLEISDWFYSAPNSKIMVLKRSNKWKHVGVIAVALINGWIILTLYTENKSLKRQLKTEHEMDAAYVEYSRATETEALAIGLRKR
jgi:hypothetical protein